jgi:glycosyltransferase involved in cell wall biosynthesis
VRVSVVIPCWRCAGSLDRAVESVLAQTTPPLEVILVDDGNSDSTPALLRELASRSPGLIRVVTLPENRGPGEARNAGWEAARGEWLAFLDADDAWHPRKLELHLAWLSSRPEVVLSSHKSVLYERAAEPAPIHSPFAAKRVNLAQLLIGDPFEMRTVILRRDVRLRFAGRHSEDYRLFLQLVADGAPSYVLDAPLACTFRPPFSVGGTSAALWTHEKGELAALRALRSVGGIGALAWVAASAWSLAKFARRAAIVALRALKAG